MNKGRQNSLADNGSAWAARCMHVEAVCLPLSRHAHATTSPEKQQTPPPRHAAYLPGWLILQCRLHLAERAVLADGHLEHRHTRTACCCGTHGA